MRPNSFFYHLFLFLVLFCVCENGADFLTSRVDSVLFVYITIDGYNSNVMETVEVKADRIGLIEICLCTLAMSRVAYSQTMFGL